MGSQAVSGGHGGKKSSAGDSGEREAETGHAGLESQRPENKKLGETEKQMILSVLTAPLMGKPVSHFRRG